LVERHAPYAPVQRYLRSEAEHRSASGGNGPPIIAPNFRGDWAYDAPLVEGAELFLEHPDFREAACKIFDTHIVRPQQVYVNLTWQLPFHQGAGHTDVPAFRGVDRTRYPIWLLSVMGRSRLFENERIRIATAVAWFYEGSDGGFEYWPDGPDAAPLTHESAIHNTAIVGDNDRMFHRVMPVGRLEDGLPRGLTLDSRLEHSGGDRWLIRDGDAALAEPSWPELRISVSWKASVFRDEAERQLVDEHREDIAIVEVLERFGTDLEERGIACPRPSEPLEDPEFVAALSGAYPHVPSVYA
jgi:hypothetical protein